MSHNNCNTNPRSFKHITERQRYQIEILIKEKKEPKEIARLLGKHRRTIEREIARGTVRMMNSDLTIKDSYCADAAQRIYQENAQNKGAGLKIGKDHKLARHIENRIIKDKYSPDVVIGEIRVKEMRFNTSICTKTLYNYIDKEIFFNITNKDLLVKKKRKKGSYKRVSIALNNIRGSSIEERPGHIETRKQYGHWEMDCLTGRQGGTRAVLLVLTERSTRQQIIRKMPDRTQESVTKTINRLEKEKGNRFYRQFKTITVDNGSEFLNWQELEKSTLKPGQQRFKLYYAHPYSSWERGSNENANKMIRRFIPKGTDIGKLSHKEIKRIEHWMNNYPRRIHGYKSANEMAA